jgi:uncharacterized protein
MSQQVLVDTGPIVALLKSQDNFHSWAKAEWSKLVPPLLTCEAVIAEACFLVRDVHNGAEAVLTLIRRGVIEIGFDLRAEINAVFELLSRYQSVPMSLADACLVRMAEMYPQSSVLTLDSDFKIYRKNRKEVISVIMPA